MKLVISGSTGFIGKHLVRRFLNDGHDVICIVRPGSKPDAKSGITLYTFNGDVTPLIGFLKEQRVSGVIHLASLFLAQHTSEDIPTLINSNVLFSTTLLEASVRAEVPWFINTGTFWQHYENASYSPVNLYAATKQAFEDIAQYYRETSPINFVTIKLCDTFGPGDTRAKIFTLWSKISASGETLDMSPGDQLIDISYIENVIEGFVQLAQLLVKDADRKLSGRSFAISSGERMSLRQLATLFEEVTGKKLNINWGKRKYRPREVMTPWDKGETIPGWKPRVSLRDGIKRLFNE